MRRHSLAAAAALVLAAGSAQAGPRGKAAEARRWAVFYGAELSRQAQTGLDLLVVDPDNFRAQAYGGAATLAYVSAGEADERRASWAKVKGESFVVESNPDWPGAHRVDVRAPKWRAVVEETVAGALDKGYQGVMLDTLDVAEYFESSAPARFAGSREAAARLVLGLRQAHPDAVILVNNGLALLDRIGGAVDGVVVEDLYTRCPGPDAPCGPTPAAESREKETTLERFHAKTGKPVFVLLYSTLRQRRDRWLRAAAARARARGFRVYLAGVSLERFGVPDPFRGR